MISSLSFSDKYHHQLIFSVVILADGDISQYGIFAVFFPRKSENDLIHMDMFPLKHGGMETIEPTQMLPRLGMFFRQKTWTKEDQIRGLTEQLRHLHLTLNERNFGSKLP